MVVFDFIEDPGHGWLIVPFKQLVELGIVGEVDPDNGNMLLDKQVVFFEEDCEATYFDSLLKNFGIEYDINRIYMESFEEEYLGSWSEVAPYNATIIVEELLAIV